MDRSILTKIEQGMESFTASEQKIAKYILNNLNEAVNLSIVEMAKKSGTSEASIVRFCKTLGLKGYQDLKIALSLNTVQNVKRDKILHEIINVDDSTKTILDKLSAGSIQAIHDTCNLLDIQSLNDAIEAIDKCDKIHIFGVGASLVVALDAQYKFTRINIPTFAFMDHHIGITAAVHLDERAVAIGISNTGRTVEIIESLKIAKEKGATTIAITQYGKSPIQDIADIVLFTANVENNFRSGAMASRISQLFVIDSLFIGVACKRYDEVIKHLRITKEALENKKY
ncbi:MurR/RpiR family transcriptional regulator [Tepidimicrobium xylanilyticum]|uniref:Transcriptional regulator, RpiR family n=1 Tax=Tepidimicrobium xylanilyticum TaxID=1123352 RepID=A0A1H3DZN2_9FIRM|nr:MurR/RpiR family transcriptional regulator [Tepidimicrobium xylanilyticum]GMG97029.1 putative HTH-type transcriptional regulator [Tepidimicrobium xylanilyticum]SDX71903.1 transcriptional regulator, RpiR family [Tepidimicrobium xylanilyticum]